MVPLRWFLCCISTFGIAFGLIDSSPQEAVPYVAAELFNRFHPSPHFAILPRAPPSSDRWNRAVCKGQALSQAMLLQADDPRMPWPQSPWDGDLISDEKQWGYEDWTYQPGTAFYCDLDDLDPQLKNMGIDIDSQQCYAIKHWKGEDWLEHDNDPQYYDVDDKKYRATGAKMVMGVIPSDGAIFFHMRFSPAAKAEDTWGRKALPEELPQLRAASDLAWGFWNRAMSGNLKNLQKIFSMDIINMETIQHIKDAMGVPRGTIGFGVNEWPGATFESSTEAFAAFLGSPNGMAVGYFLTQHKRQLGLKHVSRITVTGDRTAPRLLFWIEDAPRKRPASPDVEPPWPPPAPPGVSWSISLATRAADVSTRMLERIHGERNALRKHVMWA